MLETKIPSADNRIWACTWPWVPPPPPPHPNHSHTP
jgi:hypothetical protein